MLMLQNLYPADRHTFISFAWKSTAYTTWLMKPYPMPISSPDHRIRTADLHNYDPRNR